MARKRASRAHKMKRKRASSGNKRRRNHRPKRRGQQRRRPGGNSKLIHAMIKLKNMGASRRVHEMAAAPDRLIRDISSALHKARKRKVTLSKGLAKQVKKHAKALRMLSNPRLSIKKKRTLIKQKGGGILGTIARLIPVVGPVLGPLLDSA